MRLGVDEGHCGRGTAGKVNGQCVTLLDNGYVNTAKRFFISLTPNIVGQIAKLFTKPID
jgi:hypothetical protein